MENRPEPRVAPVRPRRVPIGIVTALAAAVLAGGLYGLTRGPESAAPGPVVTSAAEADARAETVPAPAAAATIVDAPDDGPTPFEATEAAAAAAPAVVPVVAPSPFANPPAAPAPRERAPAPAQTPRPRRATPPPEAQSANGKSDLFATLLHNIEQAPPAASVGHRPTPMDELVQQIRRENGQAQARAPQDVQAMLRACPKANTARGVQCRQKICTRFAGTDPACPAPQ
ncbi:hypothetical protein [Cognatilysobacter bugurensis]|nr:hypothetical protein [Lysobacter bugurensis]